MDMHQLVQDVLNGDESALIAFAILKEEKIQVENCIKKIEDEAREEAAKFGEKTFQHKNYSFEIRNGGKMFNFKGIKSWQIAKGELTAIEEKAKISYAASEKNVLTATEDGEEIELPIVTFRKDSLIVKSI